MRTSPNAASVAIFDGARVLLVERAREPNAGCWTLPGGRVEPGETPEACAIREAKEEVGLDISGLVPVTQMNIGDAFLLQVFATCSFGGVLALSPEVRSFRWSSLAEIGELQTTPGLLSVIEAALLLVQQR